MGKIVDYAMLTPRNTNPSVLQSVVNETFRQTKQEIAEEIKDYADKNFIEKDEKYCMSFKGVVLEQGTGPYGGGESKEAVIRWDEPLAYGWYNLYVNENVYKMCVSKYGDNRHDDGQLYMYLNPESCIIIFYGEGYETAPEIIDVRITQDIIAQWAMPGNIYKQDFYDLDGFNIGSAIRRLFAEGGGSEQLGDVHNFWDENLMGWYHSPVFSLSYETADIAIPNPILFMNDGKVFAMSFSFLAVQEEMAYIATVNVTATSSNSALVTVKVTQ